MTGERPRNVDRRTILKVGALGTLVALAGGVAPVAARQLRRKKQASFAPIAPPAYVDTGSTAHIRLAATDGFINLPGRDPLYVFGFIEGDPAASINELIGEFKGEVQAPAPIIGIDQEADVYLTLTNLGLVIRPDLDDSHTVHWHGFRNPLAVFDGVPEVSISVPVARDFPYFFRPHDPGTYMYHCHFEDVEHVQMGMNGIVYVRPAQNYTGAGGAPIARLGGNPASSVLGYVYNDGDGSTAYDRDYTLMLNEIDTRPHDNLENVQEFTWTDYKPNYWIMNGRSYPDTIAPSGDPSLPHQPVSSLIQANAGERILLRFANLGYEQHAMQLPGIPMKVVGEDATLLRAPGGQDLSYMTNTIYIGPGEARDIIFIAPEHSGAGAYDTYLLKNRNYFAQTNNGAPGLGGMVTEVHVYPAGTLAPQTEPNELLA